MVLAALVVYGTAIEPRLRLDERHYRAEIPGLPAEAAGTTVTVFSDLQLGMWLANTGMVERIVERTVELEPDAVLIAGDFVYGRSPDVPAQVDQAIELLEPLFHAQLPIYAVMGNHDHAVGAVDELSDALEPHGVTVLQNRAVPMRAPEAGQPELYVVGIGAHRPGLSRPDAAFEDVPDGAPRIVMMHNPASFPEIGADRAPLSVAGHTHCGQIALPATPAWSWLELREGERVVVDGFAPPEYGAAGNRLFVTCGIGFSLVPMRVAAPPQLVIFELAAAGGDQS